MNEVTQSKTNIITEKVSLFAEEPKRLSEYYRWDIGLTLLGEENGTYLLGTHDGCVLLEIKQAKGRSRHKTTGLYHMALLLPTRKDLGNIFNHLLERQVPIEGASDHGYSEALYLSDPEGNGIEITVDKDFSEWEVEETGEIHGVVEPMDAEGVLASRDNNFEGLPNGTIMGHVHLHINDLEKSLEFYHNVLGLGLKTVMGGSALFMATGDYHHHLGMNVWKGKGIPMPDYGDAGLDTVYWLGSLEDIDFIENALKARDYEYNREGDSLAFVDPSGAHQVISAR